MSRVAMIGVALALSVSGGVSGAADAQRVVQRGPGASYPPAGATVHYPPLPQPPVQANSRWGSKVGGRWWGGANAPGGWAAYRAPRRGWTLPRYWVAPRFYVSDWSAYGFSAPPPGCYWTRYYDDAVLIDDRGQVQDTVGGVDWDGYNGGSYYERREERRTDNGVGGAVAGAVVGGVAGNVIAGSGNRLGGTLIGAGVGAAAGYAIGHGRDRTPPPPPAPTQMGYREPLPPPPPTREQRAYQPAPAPVYAPPPMREERVERRVYQQAPGPAYLPPSPPHWVSGDGRTTVTVTTSAGAPVVYAPPPTYSYGGGYTTTIVVQSAPVVTTTTTEIIEDSVTYTRPVVRHVYRKRVWRPRPKPRSLCACGR